MAGEFLCREGHYSVNHAAGEPCGVPVYEGTKQHYIAVGMGVGVPWPEGVVKCGAPEASMTQRVATYLHNECHNIALDYSTRKDFQNADPDVLIADITDLMEQCNDWLHELGGQG